MCVLGFCSTNEYVVGKFDKRSVECTVCCVPRGYFKEASPLTALARVSEAAMPLESADVSSLSCLEMLALACSSTFSLLSLSCDSLSRKSIQRSEKD